MVDTDAQDLYRQVMAGELTLASAIERLAPTTWEQFKLLHLFECYALNLRQQLNESQQQLNELQQQQPNWQKLTEFLIEHI